MVIDQHVTSVLSLQAKSFGIQEALGQEVLDMLVLAHPRDDGDGAVFQEVS